MSNSPEQFQIKPATRQAVKPIIALYSESGCGKTLSSLYLARGLAGPTGKIVMADSESGRGSIYADVLPGGYDTLSLSSPFSPNRYIQAMEAVEASGAVIGILDSGSHEWEGLGGVLDTASANEEKSGKSGLHNWRMPKMEHARFVLKILQSPLPWIICLRAKHKTRQTRDEKGKTAIVKDDFTTPIQADDFIFEVTAHAEIFQDHSIRVTKCSHPDLLKCFPEKGPITIKHGELIGQWCAAPGKTASPSKPKGDPATDALKKELWELTKDKHEKDPKRLENWLLDETIIGDTETLDTLGPARLAQVLAAAKQKLSQLI